MPPVHIKREEEINDTSDFPRLKHTFTLPDFGTCGYELEDAAFYPYTEPGVDPVFAICNLNHVLIFRLESDGRADIIQAIKDEDVTAGNNCIAWSKTIDGIPLLCIAGRNSLIKVVNVLTGELLQTLAGHGKGVNDLAVSPINPRFLASGSEDLTIRIWSLEHPTRPCAAILAGAGGHTAMIQGICFHSSGRYLLSVGDDQTINLWTLPDFPNSNTGTDEPTLIHYPHFSTTLVHSSTIDCIAFYGDLILSKAHHADSIILWSITGFPPSAPPDISTAPTNHDNLLTERSAFSKAPSPLHQLLVNFAVEECKYIYQRFGLYSPTTTSNHPILAITNSDSNTLFWDLARLEQYHEYIGSLQLPNTSMQRPAWLSPPIKSKPQVQPQSSSRLKRQRTSTPSTASKSSTPSTPSTKPHLPLNPPTSIPQQHNDPTDMDSIKQAWDRKYALGNSILPSTDLAENMLRPHHTIPSMERALVGRKVAWSVGGEWCVVAGSPNVVLVMGR